VWWRKSGGVGEGRGWSCDEDVAKRSFGGNDLGWRFWLEIRAD